MSALSILIVDDEPLARGRISRHLRALPWIGSITEAANVRDALTTVRNSAPDILLLDIQMPDGTGFDLLRQLGDTAPTTVFVTAFDDQALRAFDANAVDYVTKPIEPGRLHAALERARAATTLKLSADRISELEEMIATLRRRDAPADTRKAELWVKSRTDFIRLMPSAITHVLAERDYVRIHADGADYLHHENLATLEAMLEGEGFLRIHRSTLVRIDAVARIRQSRFSSLVAVLHNGVELRVGRTYTAGIRRQLSGRGNLSCA